MVLSACSTYFDTILSQYEEKDPIVIMRDVKFSDIKVLVEFMYKGEINIDHVSDQSEFSITYNRNANLLRDRGRLERISRKGWERKRESASWTRGL